MATVCFLQKPRERLRYVRGWQSPNVAATAQLLKLSATVKGNRKRLEQYKICINALCGAKVHWQIEQARQQDFYAYDIEQQKLLNHGHQVSVRLQPSTNSNHCATECQDPRNAKPSETSSELFRCTDKQKKCATQNRDAAMPCNNNKKGSTDAWQD